MGPLKGAQVIAQWTGVLGKPDCAAVGGGGFWSVHVSGGTSLRGSEPAVLEGAFGCRSLHEEAS